MPPKIVTESTVEDRLDNEDHRARNRIIVSELLTIAFEELPALGKTSIFS